MISQRYIYNFGVLIAGLVTITHFNGCSKFESIKGEVSNMASENSLPPSPPPNPIPTMIVEPPGPKGNGPWPNEPTNLKNIIDCSFNNTTCDGKLGDPYKTSGSTLNIVQDQTAPFSGPNVMRSTRFANVASGGTQLEHYLPNGNKEIYVGFYWRTSAEFTGKNHGGNKMFFIRGQAPGTNGVFLFICPKVPCSTGYIIWTTQLANNFDQCGGSDVDQCNPNVKNIPIKVGSWYKIEVYMKASSTATSHDGIVKWWIDGALAGSYSKFAYGPAVDTWLWAETWDGSGPANEWTTEGYHQLDHLYISGSK